MNSSIKPSVSLGRSSEISFHADLPETMMIDRGQVEVFQTLGNLRAPFTACSKWPTVDDLFRSTSESALERLGHGEWSAAGGILDSDGNKTCDPSSILAENALNSVIDTKCGVIWHARDGRTHPIKLCRSQDSPHLLGFAISWPTHRGPPEVRFGRIAEQLLFLIHAQVLAQRRSIVFLPDVLLGQLSWGEPRSRWPKNWRQDVSQALMSLMELRSEVFRVSTHGWRPQLGAASMILTSVRDLRIIDPEEDHCREECPMSRAHARHHHYQVGIGPEFLGVLERFSLPSDRLHYREYDFRKGPDVDDSQAAIDEARKTGQIISVSTSAAVLGNARWSDLSDIDVRIIHALVRERTRRPAIVRKGEVPSSRKSEKITCSLLSVDESYIAFCGNGHRPGQGYLVIGTHGGGWLRKCGFRVPTGQAEAIRTVRKFFDHLDDVRRIVDLTIVGWNTKTKVWLSWSDLRGLNTGSLVAELPSLHVRIYAAEGFEDRFRRYISGRGGFAAIGHETTGVNVPDPKRVQDVSDRELADVVQRLRISQQELATKVGVTQPFISQLVREVRPWPERIRKQVIAVCRKRMSRGKAKASAD